MEHQIMIGSPVRCTDGKAGSVGGLLINPNRSHIDYVILNPGLLGGREYFVPSGRVARVSAEEIALPFEWAALEDLPRPEIWTKQGTVQDNLSDLCVARKNTPVYAADGSLLGALVGATADAEFSIAGVILDQTPGQAILISQMARHSESGDGIVVHLAHQAAG